MTASPDLPGLPDPPDLSDPPPDPPELPDLILAALRRHQPSGTAPLLLACSGGIDSQVLLHAASLTWPAEALVVAHVHHGLQPEADDWLDFCRDSARAPRPRLSLPAPAAAAGAPRRRRRSLGAAAALPGAGRHGRRSRRHSCAHRAPCQ